MRIVQLTAENVKRLRAVEITPDEDVVVIAGRNAQGKTSVLDAIWLALGGGSAGRETPRVIREGEDEARVTLDLGDFTVTRTWKGEKTTLNVMSKDGAKYPSPQTFLDEKLGGLSFDPLAFSRMDAKTQLATLLSLVELPFDPEELAGKRRRLFDERTELNRDLKNATAHLSQIPEFPDDTPDDEVSTDELRERVKAHDVIATAYDANRRELEKFASLNNDIERQIIRLQEELESNRATIRRLDIECPETPKKMDIAGEMERLETINANVRNRKALIEARQDEMELRGAADKLTGDIAAIDGFKADALAAAKMPIEGLAFDDDGVTFNGVPLKQASSAEQLRVSVAMAMAMNPTIRVIRMSDGSLLDSASMAIIEAMAKEHDFQCWVERVDETGAVGFTIEDGQVSEHGRMPGAAVPRRPAENEAKPRMSMCPNCGTVMPSDPTSKDFIARPDREFDTDWDGCVDGSGT